MTTTHNAKSQPKHPFGKKVNLLFVLVLSLISHQNYAQTASALNFDGANDNVSLGTSLGNFGTSNFTIETGFKTTGTSDKAIIGKRTACSNGNFWNIRIISGLIYFEIMNGTTNSSISSPAGTLYNDGNWHHVAATRSGIILRLYVDGVLVVQGSSGTVYNLTNSAALTIGSGPCGNFAGTIDETRIWNIARYAFEIQSAYNCEIANATAGLLANFHYNQGIAGGNNSAVTTLTDASGNNNNGTVLNFALTGATSNWVSPGAVTSDVACAPIAAQQFQLNGSGGQDWLSENCYQLTNNTQSIFGSIWYRKKADLTQDFDMSANLNFGTNNSPGADGMTFAFQNVCTSAGIAGCGLGIGSVAPSLIVEFDNYQNLASSGCNYNDPTYDHIAIEKNGDLNHSSTNALVAPVQIDPGNVNVETGSDYLVRVLWTHADSTLKVYVNGTLRVSYTGNIVSQLFGGSPYVYWGFTAATGGEYNIQKVCIVNLPSNEVSLSSSVSICQGSSYQANIPGAVTYSWTPVTNISNPTIANPILSPSETTTYHVSLSDACSNIQTDSITIIVKPIPDVIATGTATICSGAATGLYAGGATTYSWSPASGLDNPSIVNPTASPLSTTIYTVLGTTNGCSATDTLTIHVINIATITTGTDTICNGTSTPLGASGATTYSWLPAETLNDASLANPIATPSATTTYTVSGTTGACTTTATVKVTVNPIPVVNVNSPDICYGTMATLTATVNPIGGTYSWTSGGLAATETMSPSTTTNDTLTYIIAGCVNTAISTITVNPVPTAIAGTNTTICYGSSVPLTSSGGIDYSWSPTTGLSASNIANPLATPTVTTTYTVSVENNFLCTSSATVLITVDLCTIIAGPIENTFIRLFPNPVTASLTISFESASDESVQLLLYDISGKEMFSHLFYIKQGINTETIDLSTYANGMYFLKINTATSYNMHKVVIQH
ncbi:MAG: LamG-like jellyroll fold domain-containing protein [Bacteroidota bacterium]